MTMRGAGTTVAAFIAERGGSTVKTKFQNDRAFVIDESVNFYNIMYFDRQLFVQDTFQLTLRPRITGLNGIYQLEYPLKNGILATLDDIPSGSGGTAADPTALIGMAAINGVATTYMRSDAAPAINPAIAPTWTASHTFSAGATVSTPSGTGVTFLVNKITGTGTVFAVQAAGANKFTVDSLGGITAVTAIISSNKVTIGSGTLQASNLYISGGLPSGNSLIYANAYGINQTNATYTFTGAAQTFADSTNNYFGTMTYGSTNAIVVTNPLGGMSMVPVAGTNVVFTNPALAHGFQRGIAIKGMTSGAIKVIAQDAAGSYNFNLPTTAGSTLEFLTSAGGGTSAMTWTNIFTRANTWTNTNLFPSGANTTAVSGTISVYDANNTLSITPNNGFQISTPTGTTNYNANAITYATAGFVTTIQPTAATQNNTISYPNASGKVQLEPYNLLTAGNITFTAWGFYTFNGATATWTLPSIAGNTNITYYVKNRGTGNVTINSSGGGNDIYISSAINTTTVAPGEAIIIHNDSGIWNIQ
jgi:hypothetical protein